jgi:hypothetical protein
MSITLTADQITRIRDGARNLEEQSAAHEEQLEILVATAEAGVGRATLALSQCHTATQSDVDRLEIALNAQPLRNEDGLDPLLYARVLLVTSAVGTAIFLTFAYQGLVPQDILRGTWSIPGKT